MLIQALEELEKEDKNWHDKDLEDKRKEIGYNLAENPSLKDDNKKDDNKLKDDPVCLMKIEDAENITENKDDNNKCIL